MKYSNITRAVFLNRPNRFIAEVRPNIVTHPEFGEAMDEAKKAGVEIRNLTCHVTPDTLGIDD